MQRHASCVAMHWPCFCAALAALLSALLRWGNEVTQARAPSANRLGMFALGDPWSPRMHELLCLASDSIFVQVPPVLDDAGRHHQGRHQPPALFQWCLCLWQARAARAHALPIQVRPGWMHMCDPVMPVLPLDHRQAHCNSQPCWLQIVCCVALLCVCQAFRCCCSHLATVYSSEAQPTNSKPILDVIFSSCTGACRAFCMPFH